MLKVLSLVGRVAVAGCVSLTVFDKIGHPAIVQGSSMLPTLRGDVDRDIVWLSTWATSRPKPGQIITFTSPRDPDTVYIKRVAAVEGALVRRKDTRELLIVPEGMCWVESDNPDNRNDSNIFGPVSYGLIKARATHIVWPLGRVGHL